MKGTCVGGTIPKLFEGKMLVSRSFCVKIRIWSQFVDTCFFMKIICITVHIFSFSPTSNASMYHTCHHAQNLFMTYSSMSKTKEQVSEMLLLYCYVSDESV